MIHSLNIENVYFEKIKNGEKKIEMRLNDEKRKDFHNGDIICLKNNETQA